MPKMPMDGSLTHTGFEMKKSKAKIMRERK
jgi:hypothetical protein